MVPVSLEWSFLQAVQLLPSPCIKSRKLRNVVHPVPIRCLVGLTQRPWFGPRGRLGLWDSHVWWHGGGPRSLQKWRAIVIARAKMLKHERLYNFVNIEPQQTIYISACKSALKVSRGFFLENTNTFQLERNAQYFFDSDIVLHMHSIHRARNPNYTRIPSIVRSKDWRRNNIHQCYDEQQSQIMAAKIPNNDWWGHGRNTWTFNQE